MGGQDSYGETYTSWVVYAKVTKVTIVESLGLALSHLTAATMFISLFPHSPVAAPGELLPRGAGSKPGSGPGARPVRGGQHRLQPLQTPDHLRPLVNMSLRSLRSVVPQGGPSEPLPL